MAGSFGTLLREYRVSAGISQAELARRVNYTPGYLSKIENNLKPPNATLARLCDGVLDAGGALIAAARSVDEPTGAGAVPGTAPAGGPELAGLVASFEQFRALGRQTSPAVVLEPLIGEARAVHALAAESGGPLRSRLLALAGRVAEYIGWLHQEAGDEHSALAWTRYAGELAVAGGDRDLASYVLVREAGLALYRQDAIGTVELARQVSDGGSRTRGLAARREAQGLALAGDRAGFERAMDRAGALLASSGVERCPVGPRVADPVGLARGWSLLDLGLAGACAAALDDSVPRLPAGRSRARFGVRRALAYALAGEVEESCRTLGEVLEDVSRVDSATVRMDLRELARTLSRHRGVRAVAEIYPRLSGVLHRGSTSGSSV